MINEYIDRLKSVDFSMYFEEPAPLKDDQEAIAQNRKVGFFLILFSSVSIISFNVFVIIGGFSVGVIAYLCLSNRPKKIIPKSVTFTKSDIMNKLCAEIGLKYNKKPTNPLLVGHFLKLNLIPEFNRSYSQDEILGEIDGVRFEIQEINACQLDVVGSREVATNEFNGLLARFDFNKSIHGTTIIQEGYSGSSLFDFMSELKNVKLERSSFTDHFSISSTDQIEARYILTPDIMENIYSYSTNEKFQEISIGFSNNSVFMAIRLQDVFFEGKQVYTYNDIDIDIDIIVNDLISVIEFIDVINLSQKNKI